MVALVASLPTAVPRHFEALARQVSLLTGHGLVVKDTFIDFPAPQWETDGRGRAHSAPAAPRRGQRSQEYPPATGCVQDIPGGRACPVLAGDAGDESWQGTDATEIDISTTCSEGGDCSSSLGERAEAGSPASTPTCERAAANLAARVLRECSFLRICGHQVHFESRGRKRPRYGVAVTICFHIRGLPNAKRARWHQSLCRSVMAVLRLQPCESRLQMQGGDLFARTSHGNIMKLSFAAALN